MCCCNAQYHILHILDEGFNFSQNFYFFQKKQQKHLLKAVAQHVDDVDMKSGDAKSKPRFRKHSLSFSIVQAGLPVGIYLNPKILILAYSGRPYNINFGYFTTKGYILVI
jgi:hypothetical protein